MCRVITLHRRTIGCVVAATALLGACGDTSSSDADATPPAPTTASVSTTSAVDSTESTTAPAPPPASDTAAAAPEAAEAENPAPVTEAPAPVAPVEAALGGRAFASEITTDSDVLPDLLVDDIRRREKINLRNVFPAERPVLFWAWAPH